MPQPRDQAEVEKQFILVRPIEGFERGVTKQLEPSLGRLRQIVDRSDGNGVGSALEPLPRQAEGNGLYEAVVSVVPPHAPPIIVVCRRVEEMGDLVYVIGDEIAPQQVTH